MIHTLPLPPCDRLTMCNCIRFSDPKVVCIITLQFLSMQLIRLEGAVSVAVRMGAHGGPPLACGSPTTLEDLPPCDRKTGAEISADRVQNGSGRFQDL